MPDNTVVAGRVNDAGAIAGTRRYMIRVQICDNNKNSMTNIPARSVTSRNLGYWAVGWDLDETQIFRASFAQVTVTGHGVHQVYYVKLEPSREHAFRHTAKLIKSILVRLKGSRRAPVALIPKLLSTEFYGVGGWGGSFTPRTGELIR